MSAIPQVPWAPDIEVQFPGEGVVYLRQDWIEARVYLNGEVRITLDVSILLDSYLELDPVETENIREYMKECLSPREGREYPACVKNWVHGNPPDYFPVSGKKEWSPRKGSFRDQKWEIVKPDYEFTNVLRDLPWSYSENFWIDRFATPDDHGLVVLRGKGDLAVEAPEIWRGSPAMVGACYNELRHFKLMRQDPKYYNRYLRNAILWAYELNEQITATPGGSRSPRVRWAYEAIAEDPDIIWPDLAYRLKKKPPQDLHPALRSALKTWNFHRMVEERDA